MEVDDGEREIVAADLFSLVTAFKNVLAALDEPTGVRGIARGVHGSRVRR